MPNFGSVDFRIRSSKVANERVLFNKSVDNMTFRGNFDLFAFLASSLRTAVKWLGLKLGLGFFVSKGLGLAKMSTCISRNV